MKQNIKDFIFKNRYKLIFMSLIYFSSILSIGIVNYPYIDDISRQINGSTAFAQSYSRWGSEIMSWLVNGSRHLIDMGLTTHILTALILIFSSVIAVYVINDRHLDFIPLVCSTLIGLNPWFLQCLSFRFDSPYMALSILASLIPFLWWHKSIKMYFIMSIIGVFLMCNTYQSSSGIYIIVVLALCLKAILQNRKSIFIIRKIFFSAFAYITAMLLYFFETKLNTHLTDRRDVTEIAKLGDIPSKFISNAYRYLNTIFNQSTRIWIILFALLFLLFFIKCILNTKKDYVKHIAFTLLYFILGAVFSYGVFLIFVKNLSATYPRYYYGFAVFVSITLIMLTKKEDCKTIDKCANYIACLFMFYIISFTFIYSSTLSYQKDAFERQSTLLANDLKNIVTKQNNHIYANSLFKNSKVFDNNFENYKILGKLIDSNSDVYWPNEMLFNTYTNLNVEITKFDFSYLDKNKNSLVVSNYYYNIYTGDGNIYILMK